MPLFDDKFFEIYTWYCLCIGIIGNLVTCYLLFRRILKFKIKIAQNNPYVSPHRASLINRINLLERKHNYTIYLYFICILIADLFVLCNWILSKVEINSPINRRLAIESFDSGLNLSAVKNDIMVKFDDFEQLASIMPEAFNSSVFLALPPSLQAFSINSHAVNVSHSAKSKYSINRSPAPLFSSIHKFDRNATNFFISFKTLKAAYTSYLEYVSSKLLDIQGVCQIHYYITFVSLATSFGYTLAALLDRLLKMKVIYNSNNRLLTSIKNSFVEVGRRPTELAACEQVDETNTPRKPGSKKFSFTPITIKRYSQASRIPFRVNKSIASVDTNSTNMTDSMEIAPKGGMSRQSSKRHSKKMSKMINITYNLKYLSDSKHSEIVKQMFGKSSVFFIVIFAMLFHFHILWIYGSMGNDDVKQTMELSYELNTSRPRAALEATDKHCSIIVKQLDKTCVLLNLDHQLPLVILTTDLFLIVFLCSTTLVVCIALIIKLIRLRRKDRIDKFVNRTNKQQNSMAIDISRFTSVRECTPPPPPPAPMPKSSASPSARPGAASESSTSKRNGPEIEPLNELDSVQELGSTDEVTSPSSSKSLPVVKTNGQVSAAAKSAVVHHEEAEKTRMSPPKKPSPPPQPASLQPTSRKSKYFLVRTIISVALFTSICSLPSMATRSVLMVRILNKNSAALNSASASSLGSETTGYEEPKQTSSSDAELQDHLQTTLLSGGLLANASSHDNDLAGQSYSLLNSSSSESDAAAEAWDFQSSNDFDQRLAVLSDRLDLLLLTVSSHKFFIFLFECHLIHFPFLRSLKNLFVKCFNRCRGVQQQPQQQQQQ